MPIWLEHKIIAYLTDVFNTIGWAGVVGIMALESANIPIPSEVTMPLSGWLLVQARGGTAWEAILLGALWGAVGCTLGSLVSYGLGAWGGRPLLYRYGKYLMISHHDLEVAERWFARWGDWTSFLSRLLPIVRTFISFPAGVVRTRLLPFTVYSFLGSAIWCGALAYGGYFFGSRWEQLRDVMRPFDIPIAVVLLAGFAYYVYRHVRRGARPPGDPTPSPD
ncbi:MAG: DedA family protein [Anaerolineales bacterium]|jgi:membrane protein DedA with SNARE-associated domain